MWKNEASFNSFCNQEFKTLFNNIDLSRERESFKRKFGYYKRSDSLRNELFYAFEKIAERDWGLLSKKEIEEIFDSEKKPFCDFIDTFKEMRFSTILKRPNILIKEEENAFQILDPQEVNDVRNSFFKEIEVFKWTALEKHANWDIL